MIMSKAHRLHYDALKLALSALPDSPPADERARAFAAKLKRMALTTIASISLAAAYAGDPELLERCDKAQKQIEGRESGRA
jgi:hypothetical protein